jgi:hypothetical protein
MKGMVFLAMLCGLTAACEAQSIGGLAEVSVVDRETGAMLSPYYYRGEYWIAGRPGARYAIYIHNRLAERLMAVTSVDGVNVISGATAGWNQTGYVFASGERYQITGWRKSDAEIAAFTFTASPNSYAERTGRPANVGVIGVALFREQLARREAESDASVAARSAAPAAKLGTGHGEREYSYVGHTEFARLQSEPNEVIRIHYDSFANLLAMGIVKRAQPAPSGVNPFPASPDQQYVPDPVG